MKPPFSSLQQEPLSERIAHEIMNMIRSKQYKPGDKLPPERELAEQLNVSRPSIREALRALAIVNIVETRHGAGTYVTSLNTNLLIEHLDFIFALDQSTFLNLIEARQVIEVGLAGWAAERITDDEIRDLWAFFEQTHVQPIDPSSEAFADADYQLHSKIATIARNPIMKRFLEAVRGLGQASRQTRQITQEIVRQTVIEHHAIITAIGSRNRLTAENAMFNHLEHVRQRILAEQKQKNDTVSPD